MFLFLHQCIIFLISYLIIRLIDSTSRPYNFTPLFILKFSFDVRIEIFILYI